MRVPQILYKDLCNGRVNYILRCADHRHKPGHIVSVFDTSRFGSTNEFIDVQLVERLPDIERSLHTSTYEVWRVSIQLILF